MKLILLLLAIYSLIFYQQYKIQKSKISLPLSGPDASKPYQHPGLAGHKDFKTANFLISSEYLKSKKIPITRAGFYQ